MGSHPYANQDEQIHVVRIQLGTLADDLSMSSNQEEIVVQVARSLRELSHTNEAGLSLEWLRREFVRLAARHPEHKQRVQAVLDHPYTEPDANMHAVRVRLYELASSLTTTEDEKIVKEIAAALLELRRTNAAGFQIDWLLQEFSEMRRYYLGNDKRFGDVTQEVRRQPDRARKQLIAGLMAGTRL